MVSEASTAFRKRVCELCAQFGWQTPDGPCGTSDLDFLAEHLDRMTAPPDNRLMLFVLGVTGRYPFGPEWDRLKSEFSIHSGRSLTVFALQERARLENMLEESRANSVFHLPDDHPIYDVTHTSEYPFITGVQRVVRTVADEWRKTGKPFHLFRFDEVVRAPLLLSESEREDFFSRSKVRNSPVSAPTGLLSRFRKKHNKGLLYEIARLAYVVFTTPFWVLSERSAFFRSCVRFAENFEKNLIESIRSEGVFFKDKPPKVATRVPILYGKTIFIPEVNEKKKAIQFFLSTKENLSLTLGMIGYDLIPIYYPEHCLIQLEFMNYLRILRVVDFISCISEAVRLEFSAFILNVPRIRPAKIEAHALAGNLPVESKTFAFDSNMILTVGTLESRKNQKTFVRAARILKSRGIEGEFVVVGNRGWLADEIFAEYELAKSEGVNIKILSGLSDADLKKLYSECAFTSFISQAEGYGLPVAESLNYGKPCVISGIACLKEIAHGGGCVSVDQNDAEAVADVFAELLTDREKLKSLAASIQSSRLNTWEAYSKDLYAFVSGQVGAASRI